MVVRLGYADKLVEVRDGTVYLFNGKLWSAPLRGIVEYHLGGQGAIPGPLREIAGDIYRVLLGRNLIKNVTSDNGGEYNESAVG